MFILLTSYIIYSTIIKPIQQFFPLPLPLHVPTCTYINTSVPTCTIAWVICWY